MWDSDLAAQPGKTQGRRLLRTPLLMLVVLAAALSIAAALSLIISQRARALEDAHRENVNIARLVGFHTAHILNSGVLLLDSISHHVQSRGFGFFQSAEGKQFLMNRSQDYPELQSMLLIDKTGQLLVGATLPYPPPQANYADRDYFRLHQQGKDLVFGEQLMSRTQNRRGTTISSAIRSGSGDLEGIVLITIESAHFERLFNSIQYADNQEITIVRSDGAIFVRFPEIELGRRFPQSVVFDYAAKAKSGTYEAPSLIDGVPRLFAYETLVTSPLVVLVSQTTNSVLSAWQKFSSLVIVGLLLVLALLAAASRYAFNAVSQVEHLQLELERQAQTDSLTNLANRRHFIELAERELSRTLRYGGSLSVLMIDIDHFKKVNDAYGHAIGDLVLQRLAELFRQELRNNDLSGRLGGEEFAIVLVETDRERALEVAERLRKLVEETEITPPECGTIRFTVSIGVVCLDETNASVETLTNQADSALYEAKRDGRNKVKASWLLG